MKPTPLLRSLAALAIVASPALAAAQAPAPPPAPPRPPAAPAAPPAADAIEQGKAHFQRAVQLFRENDYRSALVEFRRSYELSKNFKVLYNIGQTEYELADYAGAQRSFQRYLAEGGAEIDAARRAEVEGELKKLAARVARIQVTSNVEGAEVLVDDVVIGTTPLKEPLLVSIGRRKVTLHKGGALSPARFVDLAGGDLTTVSLELAEAKAAPVGPVAPLAPAAPPPPPPPRTGLWISVGVTGALAVGTAVLGGMAVAAHGAAEDKLATFGVKASDVEAAHNKAKTLALVADVFGGATLAMVGVTIAVGVVGGKGDAAEPPKASARVVVGPRGLSLAGSF